MPPCIMPAGPISPAVEQPETGTPGKASRERVIEGGRVVIDGEEDDDVLEVGAAEPGFQLGDGVARRGQCTRGDANSARIRRPICPRHDRFLRSSGPSIPPGDQALMLYVRYAATGAPARQILGKYLPAKGERPPPAHKT